LALTNNTQSRAEPYHIVTQVNSVKNLNVIKMIGAKDDINTVLAGDLIARVTAQTSRQSGLSIVYTRAAQNLKAMEIYFKEEPTLSGKLFGDALFAYETSSVMGIFQGGVVKINPPMDTRIAPGDQLIAFLKTTIRSFSPVSARFPFRRPAAHQWCARCSGT